MTVGGEGFIEETLARYAGIAATEAAARNSRRYAVKLAAERRLLDSGLPVCIVRATQFHPFVGFLLGRLDANMAAAVPAGRTITTRNPGVMPPSRLCSSRVLPWSFATA